MDLKDFGNIPFRLSALNSVYPDITVMSWKAKRLESRGEIIRLKRGMFVLNPTVSGERINDFLLANHIYGPSYVSMEPALRYYGLIPESVYQIRSITLGLTRTYTNGLGTFEYIHCPEEYFAVGTTNKSEGKTTFLIATPEKALCDLVVFTRNLNLRYTEEIRAWLEEELRFDMDRLAKFNLKLMKKCVSVGRKKHMIKQIMEIIKYERNI